jgi:hypothetical protein
VATAIPVSRVEARLRGSEAALNAGTADVAVEVEVTIIITGQAMDMLEGATTATFATEVMIEGVGEAKRDHD